MLVKLSARSGQLPHSLFISKDIIEVDLDHRLPGGFADVYKGVYAGRLVAIKQPRFFGDLALAHMVRGKVSCKEKATTKLSGRNYVVRLWYGSKSAIHIYSLSSVSEKKAPFHPLVDLASFLHGCRRAPFWITLNRRNTTPVSRYTDLYAY